MDQLCHRPLCVLQEQIILELVSINRLFKPINTTCMCFLAFNKCLREKRSYPKYFCTDAFLFYEHFTNLCAGCGTSSGGLSVKVH